MISTRVIKKVFINLTAKSAVLNLCTFPTLSLYPTISKTTCQPDNLPTSPWDTCTNMQRQTSVCQWSRRPGFNPTSSHTIDSKNGT